MISDLTLHQQQVVRRLVEVLKDDHDGICFWNYTPDHITFDDSKTAEPFRSSVSELNALRSAGMIKVGQQSSMGSAHVHITPAAISAVRHHFNLNRSDRIMLALYERAGGSPFVGVELKAIAESTGFHVDIYGNAMQDLHHDQLLQGSPTNKEKITQGKMGECQFLLTERGIDYVEGPQRTKQGMSIDAENLVMGGVTTTNFQQNVNAPNTITQGIDGAALEKFIAATAALVRAAQETGNTELIQKIEDATSDIKGAKESGLAKVAGVVKFVGDLLEAGGKTAEGLTKIAAIMALLHPWVQTVVPLVPLIH